MSTRIFVDNVLTDDGKYRVLQEDSETKERFVVKNFHTKAEAREFAQDMQRAIDNAVSKKTTGDLPEIGEVSNTADESEFKDTPQDLKETTSQE